MVADAKPGSRIPCAATDKYRVAMAKRNDIRDVLAPFPNHRRGNQVLGNPLSRRGLLRAGFATGGTLAAATLLSCSTDGETSTPTPSGPHHALLAAFPQSVPHIGAGVPSRLPYLISDAEGVPLAELTEPVVFNVTLDGETILEDVSVEPRSESIPRAYVPLAVTFPEPGIYDITAIYDGAGMDSQVQAYSPNEIGTPGVGEPLPPADTPTPERPLDVDPMCTRVPACPFHEIGLPDALATGKRVVLLVATPAYCQTAVCGPIVDNLMEVVGDREDLVVIHTEVYANPKAVDDISRADLAPVPEAFDMVYEPALFVTDTSGTITDRADVIIDVSEMEEILA